MSQADGSINHCFVVDDDVVLLLIKSAKLLNNAVKYPLNIFDGSVVRYVKATSNVVSVQLWLTLNSKDTLQYVMTCLSTSKAAITR